jgi:hypothetical protein
VLVPLDRIELDPENIRSAYGEEHIANLRDALRAALVIGEEYINPPEIYPIGPEKYRVKHGNCRILAATGVVDSLHVFICELPASTAGKIVEQLSENLLQGGLNPLDTGRALRRLRDLESMSIGAIVSRLREQGLSKGRFWVTMRIGLTELHPKVQDMVAHGRIAPRGAWALRAMPPSEQVEWAERIWNGRWSFQTLTKELRAVGWLPKDFDEKLEERGGGFREPDGSAADHGYMVPASPMGPVEWQQARLGEDIRLAATGTGPDGSQAFPKEGRNGAVARRVELLAVSHVLTDPSQRLSHQMADPSPLLDLTDAERQLAEEIHAIGGKDAEASIALAKDGLKEAATSKAAVIYALNGLRQVMQDTAAIEGGSALAELLAIRAEFLLNQLRGKR